jgi:hypothetical protein
VETAGLTKPVDQLGGAEHTYLDDYELAPNTESAFKHIRWAFGTKERYYEGRIRPDFLEDIPNHDLTCQSYFRIANLASPNHAAPDKRASAVEIATKDVVTLDQNLASIVLPAQLLYDKKVKNDELLKVLEDLDVDVRLYDWEPNNRPNDYFESISNLVWNEICHPHD